MTPTAGAALVILAIAATAAWTALLVALDVRRSRAAGRAIAELGDQRRLELATQLIAAAQVDRTWDQVRRGAPAGSPR